MIFSLFTPINLTLIVLVITVILFITGKIRADLVAVCALLALVLFGILTPEEALAGFSNSVVIMLVGLFIVGGAIFRTGLAKMISARILRLAGGNENRLFLLVMLVTAFFGAFVSNTGTVAVMLPIVMSITAEAKISERRYLMPLAFASTMGLFTLISTTPNLVIQDIITKVGLKPLSFFSFAPIGAVCVVTGILVLFFLSRKLIPRGGASARETSQGKTLAELVKEYNLSERLYKIGVQNHSPFIGKTLAELRIGSDYKVRIVKIARNIPVRFGKRKKEEVAAPGSVIKTGDTLFCYGEQDNIARFVTDNQLHLYPHEENRNEMADYRDSGIAEVYVLPGSALVNKTLTEISFREKYHVNVLAIQRFGEYFLNGIQDIRINSGDALLLQGSWNDLASLDARQRDLVLVGQPLQQAAKVTLDRKAPVAALIMAGMVLVMALNLFPAVVAVLLASVLMVATGCLRNMEEAYRTINWESVVMIAAMLPMATAFEKTGITVLISNGLTQYLGNIGPYALLTGIYFGTSLLTFFISNTATAVLFAPIAMQSAIGMGVSPYPFLFAVAVSASMCFASPFSTPPNALVMSAGRYTFADFIKVGLLLQIIMGIVMLLVLPLLFPF